MQVVLMMLRGTTKTYEMDRSEQDAFGKKVMAKVGTTAYQRLRQIKQADETVDRVLANNKELLNWTARHDSETVRWRAQVVSSLQNATRDVNEELRRQELEAANWQRNVHAAEMQAEMQGVRTLGAMAVQEQRQRDQAAARVQAQIEAARKQFA